MAAAADGSRIRKTSGNRSYRNPGDKAGQRQETCVCSYAVNMMNGALIIESLCGDETRFGGISG